VADLAQFEYRSTFVQFTTTEIFLILLPESFLMLYCVHVTLVFQKVKKKIENKKYSIE